MFFGSIPTARERLSAISEKTDSSCSEMVTNASASSTVSTPRAFFNKLSPIPSLPFSLITTFKVSAYCFRAAVKSLVAVASYVSFLALSSSLRLESSLTF